MCTLTFRGCTPRLFLEFFFCKMSRGRRSVNSLFRRFTPRLFLEIFSKCLHADEVYPQFRGFTPRLFLDFCCNISRARRSVNPRFFNYKKFVTLKKDLNF